MRSDDENEEVSKHSSHFNTGDGSGNQRGGKGKGSKQGKHGGTQETTLVVDEYMCIRTISLLHGKLETDSTYRCPTYMSSTKVA